MHVCYSYLSRCCLSVMFFFFFFFQAEDGIRDTSVTGVQTCALPILSSRRPSPSSGLWGAPVDPDCCFWANRDRRRVNGPRSEERRVGKECRSRWWPEQ